MSWKYLILVGKYDPGTSERGSILSILALGSESSGQADAMCYPC